MCKVLLFPFIQNLSNMHSYRYIHCTQIFSKHYHWLSPGVVWNGFVWLVYLAGSISCPLELALQVSALLAAACRGKMLNHTAEIWWASPLFLQEWKGWEWQCGYKPSHRPQNISSYKLKNCRADSKKKMMASFLLQQTLSKALGALL